MKLIHLADLHLGKIVYGWSMLEDQRYILDQIIRVTKDERPDGVIIAGDVYDKGIPPTEAIGMFESFLENLVSKSLPVFIVSGNHDSAERLAPHRRLIDGSGVHFSPVYSGAAARFRMTDQYGEVDIYMLPFIKPVNVRCCFPEAEIGSYTDAVRQAIAEMRIDPSRRNILIAHQFITGGERSESEDVSVGGVDNVDAAVFEGFDYVALGHLHRPQDIAGPARIRYAGTPLKYSFSEAGQEKSVTVLELGEKGSVNVRTVPLVPEREMAEVRGAFDEVMRSDAGHREDYVHVTLTDEEDILNAPAKLRAVYPRLLQLDYDNARSRHSVDLTGAGSVESKTPMELFAEFYEQQNNAPMSEEQAAFMAQLIESIWEDSDETG